MSPLTEAESFNWLLASGITIRTRRILHTNWVFFPEVDIQPPPTAFTILTIDGEVVQSNNLVAAACAEFQKIPEIELDLGSKEKKIIFTSPGLRLRDDVTKVTYPVIRALATVQYEVVEEHIPFSLISYASSPSGEPITDAAVADVNLGGIKGKVMIVYKEAEGGHVVFIPEKTTT